MKLEQTLLAVDHDDDQELICDMYGIDRQRLQNQLAMIHQMHRDDDGVETTVTVDYNIAGRFRAMSNETRGPFPHVEQLLRTPFTAYVSNSVQIYAKMADLWPKV